MSNPSLPYDYNNLGDALGDPDGEDAAHHFRFHDDPVSTGARGAFILLEYSSPKTIVGVTPYGPTDKEQPCQKAAAASVAQGDQLPGGHVYAATCLHIALSAPALQGQVISPPFSGNAAAYIAIAVGLDETGTLIGVKPLRGFADGATCAQFGELVRHGVMNEHTFPKGASFLVYCLGVPVLEPSDSTVTYKRPCPSYPFPGGGPCQIATLLRVGMRR